MLILYVLVVWVLTGTIQGAAAGDDLSDFSNNLAQDLGPLIALFGEPITRQYLSESTTFLDYFIFAVCPLGIITAIVSVIRVCGHSSLRAFIGRSQEGNGVVEAELCTSTSRDVCELFNHGGITRVLGQPNVLELVCVSPKAQKILPGMEAEGHRLFLFQHYLQKMEEDECEWTKLHGSFVTSSDTGRGPSNGFAPKPNLSLNVGIKRQPLWVFILVAMTGTILQVGILFLAGFGAWMLDWTLYHPANPAYEDYAPRMFIAGTVLLCIGMWSCAALVGQATQEVTYKRRTTSTSTQHSRLLWLQPGPQVIGDQSFDPFSHFESPSKPLRYWTSSRKGKVNRAFEMLTFFAGICTMVGYVLQFIGLRGLKAWVSIAQLAITLIMSFLRGLLRMQRFGNDDNRLAKMPDLVPGHELDWMAFEIARPESSMLEHTTSHNICRWLSDFFMRSTKRSAMGAPEQLQTTNKHPLRPCKAPYWHITGQYAAATKSYSEGGGSSDLSDSQDSSLTEEKPGEGNSMPDAYQHLLPTRVRLAHLTGHFAFEQLEESEYQTWKDSLVRVRARAKMLSAAIEEAIHNLISYEKKHWQREDIALRIKAIRPSGSGSNSKPHEQEVIVAVKAPANIHSTQPGWRVDSAQIEALLGLWMWSLIYDERLVYEDETSNQYSSAEKRGDEAMQIISAGYDDDSWGGRKQDIEDEMNLWLGSTSIGFPEYILHMNEKEACGNNDLWILKSGTSDALEKLRGSQSTTDQMPRRLFGWNAVYKSLGFNPYDEQPPDELSQRHCKRIRLKIQCLLRRRSLLDICTQELFIALISSFLASKEISMPSSTIQESEGNIQLNNRVVDDIARAFVDSGLGARSEALLCIVPALRGQILLDRSSMFLELATGADAYRRHEQWDRAERLLRWACQVYSSPLSRRSEPGPDGRSTFEFVLQKTAELYRWSLANATGADRRKFAKEGIDWLSSFIGTVWNAATSEGEAESDDEIQRIDEMVGRYKDVLDKFERDKHSPPTATSSHPLVQAIRDHERTLALYHLCFVKSADFGSKALQPALPLAVRNNWPEVVEVILEMNGSPDSQDEGGRTAASYCAELGHWWYLRTLQDHGAFFDRIDKAGRTPLHWAAQSGQSTTCSMLLDSQSVDHSAEDHDRQTPFWYALSNGQLQIMDQLLDVGVDIDGRNKHGQTPLFWMAKEGKAADTIIPKLLEHGSVINQADADGRTPLYWAAMEGNTAAVSILAEKGANVNQADSSGRTPLARAAERRHEGAVQKLLDAGADVNQADDSKFCYPLALAAEWGCYAVAQQLLASGAKINGLGNQQETPMLLAAAAGQKKITKLLLDNGAEVDHTDSYCRTPLRWAAEKGHDEIVAQLLDKGADINYPDRSNDTPLFAAAEHGHNFTVMTLLDRGAEVNHQNKYGQTALSRAAERGFDDVVKQLLLHGAEVDLADSSNKTALACAAGKGHVAIVNQLLDKGADVNHIDDSGYTALSWADKNWHSSVVALLLEKGAVVVMPRT
ncbi:Pfs, ankyrin repeats & 6-phosphofructo-2-kinase [Tolypocladium paradoxum]|uniref:Pfs, ankyrin repeats & 6-phosphofructo-2-kinase n=1 Tax=Tolypocladium paradoxum TaxID=94208 RepID=A0A2S4L2X3_9HYPO|nr:Pfs, ankyrin repeats & 6-phosphofructo-2-kinase [Tolypocladium paradoxum]